MAFDTYEIIKRDIGRWLARSDLTTYLGDFIALGEARLARELRIRGIEADLSVAISSGAAAVPADFVELKHARLDATPSYPLEPKDSQWLLRKFPMRTSDGPPQFIAVDGANFIFGPYPDTAYTILGVYYFKPAVLSDSNTTNEWTANVSDALFFASLSESAPFIGQDNRLATWEAKYEAIKNGYNVQQKRQARRGARMSYN